MVSCLLVTKSSPPPSGGAQKIRSRCSLFVVRCCLNNKNLALYPSDEAWSFREDLFKRLRSFHNRCARSMCRVNLHHPFRHHITTLSLFRRLNLLDIDSYYHNRLLRWAGHVARMPMSRAPRQLLSSWVANSRPVGCPQMTWGRTLENALASKGISKEFEEWIAIAKDRPKWRQQTHSKQKPPDA